MPDKKTICYYAMYVIGEVESRWDWGAFNLNDAITLGMLQWWGTRACDLLNRYKSDTPDDYAKLSESLRSDVENHSVNETWFWQNRYLTLSEGNSFASASESDESHAVQEEVAIADFENYYDYFSNMGVTDAKPMIFMFSMYHQNPTYCRNVVSSCGAAADLDLVYTTCLNHPTFSQYRTRYTTIYNRLKEWDGESDPPDFGQNGNIEDVGGEGGSVSEIPAQITHIMQVGDNLMVYGINDYADGVLFVKSAGQTWVNSTNPNGTEIEGGTTGGGATVPPDEAAAAAVDWMLGHKGQFSYSQNSGRLTPLSSGYTDCSGCVWAAFFYGAGVELKTSTGVLAQYTGTQVDVGELVWEGSSVNEIPWDLLTKGDLVLQSINESWVTGGYGAHIELYTGENQTTIGHPSGMGPTTRSGASVDVFGGRANKWVIRRYHA